MFYCGRPADWSLERICLTTSEDLVTWEKHVDNPILVADGSAFSTGDFRDPFPMWNPEEGRFWLVLSSKLADESAPRRGCLALATSENLLDWELHEPPLYAPNTNFSALECADIFELGGRWHLLYGTSRGNFQRIADSPSGPWQAVGAETGDPYVFGGHPFSGIYVPKTLHDGERRLLLGWLGTQEPQQDDGRHQWGGDLMIPRELTPLPNGELAETCPQEILDACGPDLDLSLDVRLGEWHESGSSLQGGRLDGLAYAVVRDCPSDVLLEFDLTFSADSIAAGLYFRSRPDLTGGYALRLEPDWNRVAIERWQEPTPSQRRVVPLAARPLAAVPGKPIPVQLFIDGSIIEVFVDRRWSTCCRGYDFDTGELGFFVENGEATFENVRLRQLPR